MIMSLAQWLERHASYLKDVGLLMFARLLPLDLDLAKHHQTRRLYTRIRHHILRLSILNRFEFDILLNENKLQ